MVPRRRGRSLIGGVALVVVAMVGACGSLDGVTVYSGPPMSIVAAADGIRVIVADTPSDGSDPAGPSELWAVSREGSRTDLGHASLPECPDDNAAIDSLRSLSQGRLGAVIYCFHVEPGGWSWYYATIDLSPLRLTAVAVLPPYAGAVVWSDGSSRGWVQTSDAYGTCEWIAQYTTHSAGSLPSNWPRDPATPVPAPGCGQPWRTTDPGMAPGGHQLFFMAAHVPADDTIVKGWGLYCFDEDSGTVSKITDGFGGTVGIDVRSDQGAVVVAGNRGGDEGLWRVNTATGQIRKISAGFPSRPSLATDGTAVIVDNGDVKVIIGAAS